MAADSTSYQYENRLESLIMVCKSDVEIPVARAVVARPGSSAAAPRCLAQGLTIAAASDLQSALPAIASQFEKETGQPVRLTFGSSGNFFNQIQNGAPFDLFLSADIDYPRRLEASGTGGTRQPLPVRGRPHRPVDAIGFGDRRHARALGAGGRSRAPDRDRESRACTVWAGGGGGPPARRPLRSRARQVRARREHLAGRPVRRFRQR